MLPSTICFCTSERGVSKREGLSVKKIELTRDIATGNFPTR